MGIGKLQDEASLERWLQQRIEQMPLNTVQGLPGQLASLRATLTEFEEEGLPPSGGAGGVLKGTYPNPGFAVDMATQAELDAEKASREGGDTSVAATAAEKLATHAGDTTEIHGIADTAALALKSETVSKAEVENFVEGPETSTDNAIVSFDGVTGKLIKEAPAGSIKGTLIAGETIKGEHIANTTITAGKLSISELSAISAKLGTITSGSITGATFATAKEGARVEIDTKGIRGLNLEGKEKFNFETATGILFAEAVISAEEGTVIPTKYLAGQITETQIEKEAVNTPQLVANAVTAAKIAAKTITASQIASATITSEQIAATTIKGSNIAAGTITAEKLNVEKLSAITANLGSVTAGNLESVVLKLKAEAAAAEGDLLWYSKEGSELVGMIETVTNSGRTSTYLRAYAAAPKAAEVSVERRIIDNAGTSDFLQLTATAKRKVNFGEAICTMNAGTNASTTTTVNHGLGVKPVAVLLVPEAGSSGTVMAPKVIERTTTQFKFMFASQTTFGVKTEVNFLWTAIG